MNTKSLFPLCILSMGLALSASMARADDPTTPPAPPSAAPAPAEGAQVTQPPRQGRMRGGLLAILTDKLNLTADQQKKVGEVLADARAQVKALRNDDSLSDEDLRAKVRDVRTTARGQIRAVLTPEQQATFDTLPAHAKKAQAPAAN